MLKPELPSQQKALEVPPREVTVVLAENGRRALTFVLPPLDDLAEIEALKRAHFSVRDLTSKNEKETRERFQEDLVALKKKADRFPESATFHNRIANLASLAGDLDQEARSIKRAREISNDVFFAHKAAENLLARGRTHDAKELIAQLNFESDLYANLRRAYFCVQDGRFAEAEPYVAQALKIDALDFGAQLFSGALSLLQGRYAKAIHAFRAASDIRGTSSALFSNIAIAYFQLGQLPQALAAAKRSVNLDPLNANAVFLLSDLAFKLKQSQDAIPSLRYFVEYDQKTPGIWARLARALLQTKQFNESIAALKSQNSLEETSSVWNNMGVAYQHLRSPEKAMPAFQRAMLLDSKTRGSDYFLAARNLAQSFVAIGDPKTAISLVQHVLDEDKHEICLSHERISEIYSIYVYALVQNNRSSDAVRVVEGLLHRPNLAHSLTIWAVGALLRIP